MSADVASGRAPLTVRFVNQSTGATSFEWDFGDGQRTASASAAESVAHEYVEPGSYEVVLRAIGAGDSPPTDTATLTVDVGPGPLAALRIDATSIALAAGETRPLAFDAVDKSGNAIPDAAITFTVAPQAGAIDDHGVLTAGRIAGEYEAALQVTAVDGAVTRSVSVGITVAPGPLDRIEVDPPAVAVSVMAEQALEVTAFDAFDNVIEDATLAFRAQGGAGAINDAGVFAAGTAAGEARRAITVDATDGVASATVTVDVIVTPGPLDRVKIAPAASPVPVTGKQQFTAVARDAFGNEITDASLSFTAQDEAGSIAGDGVFTAGVQAGTYPRAVSVTAKAGGASVSTTAGVVVLPGPLTAASLEPSTGVVEVAGELQFSVAGLDEFGNPIPDLEAVFAAAEEAGGVDAAGLFTAGTVAGEYAGAVTVEMTQGAVTLSAAADVTLEAGPLSQVVLAPDIATLDIGETLAVSVEALDAYGNSIPGAELTWSVAEGAGSLDESGVLTAGTRAGSFDDGVIVTATLGETSAEAAMALTVRPGPLDAVVLVPVEMVAGESLQLTATAADQYGNTPDGVELAWRLLDPDGGSLSPSGEVTAGEIAGLYAGAVEVEAAQGEVSRVVITELTILPGALDQVVVAPRSVDLGMGMTQQFIAVGADRFGNRVAGLEFTWSVEVGGGAIDQTGLFTAGEEPATYADTVKVVALGPQQAVQSAAATVTVEPDRIVFRSDRNDEQLDLYLMDADGSNVQRLTASGVWTTPAWSPDGRRLVYSDAGEIYTMDDGGGSQVLLLSESFVTYEPAWSPDGSKIAYQSWEGGTAEIYIMDVDGGNRTRLTNNSAYDDYPRWSPDGQRLVFVSDRDGNEEIYVMRSDGTNPRRLTFNALSGSADTDTFPAWSPDGLEILFMSGRASDAWAIYVMNTSGGDVRQLTPGVSWNDRSCPSWSRDGTKVLFHGFDGEDTDAEIYVMDADGSNEAQVTDNDTDDYCPRWAPRKRGIEVSEDSIVIPNASSATARSVQEVTAMARAAVVRVVTEIASGSGFVIDPDGLILTNDHVVRDGGTITVYMDDGSSHEATIVGRDMIRDLAVLKIEAADLPYLELGEVGRSPLASEVVVLGFPLGEEELTVTRGVLSAFKSDDSRNISWVQTDAAVNPGNSGGPMLNLQGQVIGIVSAKIVALSIENVGFAISSNVVRLYLDRLKQGAVIGI